MTKLEELRKRLNPEPEGRCLIALSGGGDSVALTHLLLPLRDSGRILPEAVHVNHGLRGGESDADEAFVRSLCAEAGLPLHTVRLDLEGRRDENSAREARYGAIFRVMKEREIRTLVLAHQMQDQAETFLMRLLRGAGPEGLGGMRPSERRGEFLLLRPLLEISGEELRDALREAGLTWREDGSNREDVYLRNRIRRDLIPQMEAMAPGAAGRIARTAGLIAEENEAMAEAAEKLLSASVGQEGPDAETLREAPAALRSRALRQWWRNEGPELEERELSYEQTRRLAALAEAPRGTIINLPGNWRARREKNSLRLLEPGNRTRNNRPAKEKRKKDD